MATPNGKADVAANYIPGPGTYNVNVDNAGGGYLGDAPSYSMGARKKASRPDDQSPGPVYSPRMLTPQSAGPIGDAAQYSFGSSKRFEPGRSGDPGPGQYKQDSTRVGGSLLGDAPKYGFGSSSQREGKRFVSKEHANKANYALHSPGPLMYNPNSALGETLTGSGQPNSPRYTMRPRLAGYKPSGTNGKGEAIDQPGPGTYNASQAFGQQVHSARNSAASYGFGTSGRHRPELQPKKTVYIGKDFERQNWGIHSPGPSLYGQKSTLGSAAQANIKTSPAFSFASESRW